MNERVLFVPSNTLLGYKGEPSNTLLGYKGVKTNLDMSLQRSTPFFIYQNNESHFSTKNKKPCS